MFHLIKETVQVQGVIEDEEETIDTVDTDENEVRNESVQNRNYSVNRFLNRDFRRHILLSVRVKAVVKHIITHAIFIISSDKNNFIPPSIYYNFAK